MSKSLLLTLLAVCVAGPILGGCSDMPVFIGREQEIAMGREAAPQFEKEFGGEVASEKLQSYVSSIGQQVAKKSARPDLPYEFALLESDTPNAFALPGGKIYVTRGLVEVMTNERQLAAVLSHEVGHVAQRHNVKALQAQMGGQLLAQLAASIFEGTAGQVAGAAAKVATGMANLKYSRSNEYQADKVGIDIMTAADYDPEGMVELLQVLYSLHEQEPGRFGEMFQTHPLTSKRIENARQYIKDNYPSYQFGTPPPNEDKFLQMRSLLKKT
ncbi:MAG: M48 family metalloprotease [Phycisphaerae bacterium]